MIRNFILNMLNENNQKLTVEGREIYCFKLPDECMNKLVLFRASLQLRTCASSLPRFALSIVDYHPIPLPSGNKWTVSRLNKQNKKTLQFEEMIKHIAFYDILSTLEVSSDWMTVTSDLRCRNGSMKMVIRHLAKSAHSQTFEFLCTFLKELPLECSILFRHSDPSRMDLRLNAR